MASMNIKTVAAAAGVSVATISRALQSPDRLAPDTLAHVRRVIADLGYTPNAQARNLRTAKTKLVIALVPDISNPFFSEVIRGIEQVSHRHGYAVLLGDTQNDPVREQHYADLVSSRRADGLITLLPHIPIVTGQGRLPIINACEYAGNETVTCVMTDNIAGAYAAVNYLLMLGHRHIALLNGPADSPLSRDRALGYQQALIAAGIDTSASLETDGEFSSAAGAAAVDSLIARGERFTGLFCANDEIALGAISALRAHGRRVPDDVSVVGFDDIRFARYFDPPLTTVAQPMSEIGQEAMRLLLTILDGSAAPPHRRILNSQLVIRGSAAAA